MAKWVQLVFVGIDNLTYWEKLWLLEEGDTVSIGTEETLDHRGLHTEVGTLYEDCVHFLKYDKSAGFAIPRDKVISITDISQNQQGL